MTEKEHLIRKQFEFETGMQDDESFASWLECYSGGAPWERVAIPDTNTYLRNTTIKKRTIFWLEHFRLYADMFFDYLDMPS